MLLSDSVRARARRAGRRVARGAAGPLPSGPAVQPVSTGAAGLGGNRSQADPAFGVYQDGPGFALGARVAQHELAAVRSVGGHEARDRERYGGVRGAPGHDPHIHIGAFERLDQFDVLDHAVAVAVGIDEPALPPVAVGTAESPV